MNTSSFLAALLVSAGIASAANAEPPQSATGVTATTIAPSPVMSATGVRQSAGMNFATPGYVEPPPGQAGSPGASPNGNNNAQTPNGNNNARNPNGNNNAQSPNGGDSTKSPSGNNNAPNPGGSSSGATPITK